MLHDCQLRKTAASSIKVQLNKDTKVAIDKKGDYQCFTVVVPKGVNNLKISSSSSSILMAIKAAGYPDITRVVSDKHDGFNDCAIPAFNNDCTISSVKAGVYKGVIQRSIFGSDSANIDFTILTPNQSAQLVTDLVQLAQPVEQPSTYCSKEFTDEESYTNTPVFKSTGEQSLGMVGGKKASKEQNSNCYRLAVPKNKIRITLHPENGVSKLVVGEANQIPSTRESKDVCVISNDQQPNSPLFCDIKPSKQSGYYYVWYQNNNSKALPGGTISIDYHPTESNYSK
ncbi:hypothetical protein JQC92_20320 [Shewanella sp. 202IG2-18]|uniref:hypothetical protein n=1 Tax=Parashewanella hymeniacidonis TaxID=2807618 RepID=UPI00195F3D75|nr:hypothetical protein [Parashewanella hymeniacidonis]MBM7074339.1 hypothetical protein [Parashewanella hymeniacidonis]